MWFNQTYFSALISLLTSVILGGIIGFERAGKNHDAGLRTHILVCLGSTTVMILSKIMAIDYGVSDIMRLGAQVISGIGFLGVGCIIVTGDRVKGLTTAAGLWTTACLGLVIGMGYYLIAVTIVLLMLFAILGLRPLAMRFQEKLYDFTINISINDREIIGNLFVYLNELGIDTASVKLEEDKLNNTIKLSIEGHSKKLIETDKLISKICSLDGVESVIFL